MNTRRLEASVASEVFTQLDNLGWVVDEKNPANNVTQQRPKTEIERTNLRNAGARYFPDFVLYAQDSTQAIGIIEVKRPGETLDKALEQAADYAQPLNAPLIFAYSGSFVEARHVTQERSLKIDGEDVRQFIDHFTSLRFINEGPEILSGPEDIQISRSELVRIFKRQADYLREAGLSAGLERFGAFSDVLFLKLMDEVCQLREHSGEHPPLLPHLRWSDFENRGRDDRLQYVTDVVWPAMREQFGSIFSDAFPISSAEIFDDIVKDMSRFNFTGTDADVKGDAFEYFLKNAYQGIKIKDLGEYFTPRNIVRTMVSITDPKFGETVYDPFCGTGGFLIETFRYISLRIKVTNENEKNLKTNTVFGTEIATTARIARMNMILFGDGHSNVTKNDSFANPINEKFDVVLTNPPYSQRTRHGNLYAIPSTNGDAVSVQHCFQSLKSNGRAALLVKDDFLTEGGDVGRVRDMVLSMSRNVSIVSLPRRLFEPYTPTKTSILYFEKAGKRKSVYFFIVNNVGHTFGTRKKSLTGNDLPHVLESIHSKVGDNFSCNAVIVDQDEVRNKNSLWPYDYTEIIPPTEKHLTPLGDLISISGERLSPSEFPDQVFQVLGVSNDNGIFLNEEKIGGEITQRYIRVSEGDLVYNPHRVNVGSIGVVPSDFDGGIVSGIYVVFRPKKNTLNISSEYIYYLLKSPIYIQIIRAYDTRGSVRANLSWDQLCRIKFPVPTQNEINLFMEKNSKMKLLQDNAEKVENEMWDMASGNNLHTGEYPIILNNNKIRNNP
ncbi:MAG: N-6 DNA methylase [Gammaproteobacteria bacterium]|nr:N-6 DNA methylase [Gammaproteobacteria bacterium]